MSVVCCDDLMIPPIWFFFRFCLFWLMFQIFWFLMFGYAD